MKNSSRFEETIARNFTRSSSGTSGSSASCSTRSLKSIHDSSRLKYNPGSLRFGAAIGSGSTSVTVSRSSHPGELKQHALSQAAAADLQRAVERAACGLEREQPRGHQPHALGVELEARRHVRSRTGGQQRQRTREAVVVQDLADEPAQRGGAPAHRDGGIDRRRRDALQNLASVEAHLVELL